MWEWDLEGANKRFGERVWEGGPSPRRLEAGGWAEGGRHCSGAELAEVFMPNLHRKEEITKTLKRQLECAMMAEF
jgi:hypothetical protein